MSPHEPASLAGRTAVVTGAGSGIGKAIAEELAACGANVLVTDINGQSAERVADDIGRAGGTSAWRAHDVCDVSAASELLSHAGALFGMPTVLVNNAGIAKRLRLADITPEDWDTILSINSRGSFFLMQAAAEIMRQVGGGSIINISSMSAKGYRGTSSAAYAASKAAVVAMSRVAAIEYAPHGVRINCLCPGLIRTPLLTYGAEIRAARSGRSVEEEIDSHGAAVVPLSRVGEPHEIARVVSFLASDAASYVTGQAWNVDGGVVFD